MDSPSIPARIGPYDVERLLYRGATGAVYLSRRGGSEPIVLVARSLGASGLPATEHEETGARTLRAARAALALAHPGIVRVLDFGEDEEGLYLVYERPEGHGLGGYVDAGIPLPAATVLEIGRQAGAALGVAHGVGLAHGDVRPAHLFLDDQGHASLVGFGLTPEGSAVPLREDALEAPPDFTAPERIAGRPADARSDLFSLAATLYSLLAGRTPFGGESASSTLYRIVNDPPRSLRGTAPDLPPALDAFFSRALAKDPVARFPDADSFCAALAELSATPLPRGPLPALPRDESSVPAHEEISPPPGPGDRARGAARPRHGAARRVLAALAGLLVALALALGVWWVPAWLGVDPFAARRRGVEDQLERLLGPVGRAIRWTVPERRIRVITEPPGLELAVAGNARLEGSDEIAFVPEAAGSFTVRVADRCMEGEAALDTHTVLDVIRIDASPRAVELDVTTEPPGAELAIDGDRHAGVTPVRITLPACRSHELLLSAEGRTPRRVALAAEASPEAWRSALRAIGLEPVPKGELAVPAAPAGFNVDVYARRGEGLVRLARAGESISLDPGPQHLLLRDPAVLFEREVRVDVAAGEQATLPVDYPALGQLSVRVVPPGGPVLVRRGRGPEIEIGATALAPRALVAGRYTVILIHPGSGARATRTVEIRAGETAEVRVGSNEW